MPDQESIDVQIARLEALLNAGATNVESDGERVEIDLNAVRTRLAELKAQQTGRRHQARRVRTLDLGSAF